MLSIPSDSAFSSLGEIIYISIANPYKNPRNPFRYLLNPCLDGNDSKNIFIDAGDPNNNCKIYLKLNIFPGQKSFTVEGHEEQEML